MSKLYRLAALGVCTLVASVAWAQNTQNTQPQQQQPQTQQQQTQPGTSTQPGTTQRNQNNPNTTTPNTNNQNNPNTTTPNTNNQNNNTQGTAGQNNTQGNTSGQSNTQGTTGQNTNRANQVTGRITSTANDHFVVRTQDNRDVTFYTNDRSRYLRNNSAAKYSDLSVGNWISTGYTTQGDRWYVDSLNLLPGAPTATTSNLGPQTTVEQGAASIEGTIVSVNANQVVVRTRDNKELSFMTGPQSRILMNNQPVAFTNLRQGANVSISYITQGNNYMISQMTVQPVQQVQGVEPAGQATVLTGSVVRVIGNDQVVVRTSDGKEVIVHTMPQTTYTYEDRPVQFQEVIRPGSDLRIQYDTRDNRNVARSIFGLRRK